MAQFLKQSTAFTFRIGPFVDSTDGVTAETALTIGQADIQISKAGGAFAQTSASPTTTHDADGWYQCPLTTTDTGTLGTLTVQVVMAGALPVWKDFMVLPANVYDSLIAGSDVLNADVTYWNGSVLTGKTGAFPEFGIIDSGTAQSATGTTLVLRSAAAFADSELIGATVLIVSATAGAGQRRLITANVGATDTVTVDTWTTTPSGTIVYLLFASPPASATLLPAVNMTQINGDAQSATDLKDFADAGYDPATNKVQGVVLTDTVTTYTGNTPQTGDAFARLGAPAGASIAADIAVIEAQTDDIGVAGAGLTALATQASVDAIDNFLDTEIAAILALLDDPRTEPGQGAPPVNPDLATKIDYLYKAWRNRSTQTATTYSLYADDGTTVDQKATLSDDATTFVKGEVATGP